MLTKLMMTKEPFFQKYQPDFMDADKAAIFYFSKAWIFSG